MGTLDGERAEGSGTGTGTGTTSAEMSKVWGGVELSAARSGRRTAGERGGARLGTGRTSNGRAVPPPVGVEPVSDDEEGGLYTCGGSSDNLEAMKKALCVRATGNLKESAAASESGVAPAAGARGERGKRATEEHATHRISASHWTRYCDLHLHTSRTQRTPRWESCATRPTEGGENPDELSSERQSFS